MPKRVAAKWRLIVFVKGKRQSVLIRDPRQGLLKVKDLTDRGYKAHLVSRLRAFYPAEDDDFEALNDGKLWCPYCRRWRFFSIPKYMPDTEVGSDSWYLNTLHMQEISCCQWCTISENDFHVKTINGTWGAERKRSRKRKRRSKRR